MWTLIADYINNLSFDYIEIYSFRRGAEYEQLVAAKPDLEYNGGIINENGELFPYSIKTHTFRHDHPTAIRIKELLQIEIEQHFSWLCAPVFREAIVFYDRNNHMVSCLNICLSCWYLQAENLQLKADYKTYGYLKKLFLELGHNVEYPDYDIIADVEAMKKKIKKPKR
jgi:hypothetical protein